jgi:hypothetical protein
MVHAACGQKSAHQYLNATNQQMSPITNPIVRGDIDISGRATPARRWSAGPQEVHGFFEATCERDQPLAYLAPAYGGTRQPYSDGEFNTAC